MIKSLLRNSCEFWVSLMTKPAWNIACSCSSKKSQFLCAADFTCGLFRRDQCKGYSIYLKKQGKHKPVCIANAIGSYTNNTYCTKWWFWPFLKSSSIICFQTAPNNYVLLHTEDKSSAQFFKSYAWFNEAISNHTATAETLSPVKVSVICFVQTANSGQVNPKDEHMRCMHVRTRAVAVFCWVQIKLTFHCGACMCVCVHTRGKGMQGVCIFSSLRDS